MNGDDRSLKLGASNEKLVLFVIRIVCLGLGYWSFVLITDAVLKAARAIEQSSGRPGIGLFTLVPGRS